MTFQLCKLEVSPTNTMMGVVIDVMSKEEIYTTERCFGTCDNNYAFYNTKQVGPHLKLTRAIELESIVCILERFQRTAGKKSLNKSIQVIEKIKEDYLKIKYYRETLGTPILSTRMAEHGFNLFLDYKF